MKMEKTQCFEMSVYKIQTLGNYPEENTQNIKIYLGTILFLGLGTFSLPTKRNRRFGDCICFFPQVKW
jgi:hypothetical protein